MTCYDFFFFFFFYILFVLRVFFFFLRVLCTMLFCVLGVESVGDQIYPCHFFLFLSALFSCLSFYDFMMPA